MLNHQPGQHVTATAALTWRSCVIGVFAMLLLGMWVHFHEVLLPQPLPIAENSPPAAGVGIFLGVLLVAGLVTWFRPRLRLTQPELCAIYAMLIIAGPLMSQGMWHRFPGLIAAIPHHSHNLALADSYSTKLWPHGPRLLDDDYPLAAQADPAGLTVDLCRSTPTNEWKEVIAATITTTSV